MDELIARVTATAGIDAETAQKALAAILGFLRKEGPEAEVAQLLAALPGAGDLAGAEASGGGGALGGLMGLLGGGGLMGLAGQLTALGLGMDQMQAVGKELFAFGREKAGEDLVGQIAGAIPGLAQFI